MPAAIMPGPTELARTPNLPSSAATALTKASTAPFGDAERTSLGGYVRTAIDVTATRLPFDSRK